MVKTVRVDKIKCTLLALSSLLFLICALALFMSGSPVPAALCLLLAFIYAAAAAFNGATVRIDSDGVSRRILWFPAQACRWDEMKEVGVFGTKLFNRRNPSKTGTLYLYVSKQNMTDDQRFQMVLRWPPKQIYFAFHSADLELIRRFWPRDIVGYNVGDLVL